MSQSDADCDDGGGDGNCTPWAQIVYLAPGPPSSQSPSEARLHVSVQRICALVSPTILRADQSQVKSKRHTRARRNPTPHMSCESVALVASTALPASSIVPATALRASSSARRQQGPSEPWDNLRKCWNKCACCLNTWMSILISPPSRSRSERSGDDGTKSAGVVFHLSDSALPPYMSALHT